MGGLVIVLSVGLAGALAGVLIGLPLPFLLGSMGAVAGFAIWRGPGAPKFPQPLRQAAVALIGALIGATFAPETLALVPGAAASLAAIVPLVLLCLGAGFTFYRHVAGYDPVTAFYAAMPGGLVEATSLGIEAGADAALLSVQHFARIVIVVVMVPAIFWAGTGIVVGSAGGQSLSAAPWTWAHLAGLLALTAVGGLLGPRLRLPAGYMTGAMLLSAGLHGTGVIAFESPWWLFAVAQLVVGCGLGVHFAGTRPATLARAFGYGACAVGLMLVIAAGLAALVAPWSPLGLPELWLSFAPGGVTEMGLIALSLGLSPVLVVLHHLLRIALTVVVAGVGLRALRRG